MCWCWCWWLMQSCPSPRAHLTTITFSPQSSCNTVTISGVYLVWSVETGLVTQWLLSNVLLHVVPRTRLLQSARLVTDWAAPAWTASSLHCTRPWCNTWKISECLVLRFRTTQRLECWVRWGLPGQWGQRNTFMTSGILVSKTKSFFQNVLLI